MLRSNASKYRKSLHNKTKNVLKNGWWIRTLVFTCLQYKSFENIVGKGKISAIPTVFTTCLENFLPFSLNLKLSSTNSFSLEESKNVCLGKGCTEVFFFIFPSPSKSLTKLYAITTQYQILTHYIAVENIVRKGEIACNKQFLLFKQCFLPYMILIFHFRCTLKYRLQFVSILTSLKFCCLVMGKCSLFILTKSI